MSELVDGAGQHERPRALIYVVDDDPYVREALTEVLAIEHYHVQGYEDGAKAWTALQDAQNRGQLPNLILTDALMPNMSGQELIRLVQNQSWGQKIPYILMSASDLCAEEQFLNEICFLRKPYALDELYGLMRRLLPAELPPEPLATYAQHS